MEKVSQITLCSQLKAAPTTYALGGGWSVDFEHGKRRGEGSSEALPAGSRC